MDIEVFDSPGVLPAEQAPPSTCLHCGEQTLQQLLTTAEPCLHWSNKHIGYFPWILVSLSLRVDLSYSLHTQLNMKQHLNCIYPFPTKGTQQWCTSTPNVWASSTHLFSLCNTDYFLHKGKLSTKSLTSRPSSCVQPYSAYICHSYGTRALPISQV